MGVCVGVWVCVGVCVCVCVWKLGALRQLGKITKRHQGQLVVKNALLEKVDKLQWSKGIKARLQKDRQWPWGP